LLLLLLLFSWLVTKGCSGTFVPFLKRMFNLRLAQQYLPTVWKEESNVLVFKKGGHVSATTNPFT
jgi:hypothetical protein